MNYLSYDMVAESSVGAMDLPNEWEQDYCYRLSKALHLSITRDNSQGIKIPKPLREYDTGLDGFVKFCFQVLRVRDPDTQELNPMVIWSGQRDLVQKVLDNRRTACISGHSMGKSYLSAALCIWWFCCRGRNFFTTAPTQDHMKTVMWKNIKVLKDLATRDLPGVWSPSCTLKVPGNDEWFGKGFVSGDKSEGVQGFHYVGQLIIGDEAAGLSQHTYASFRSSMASENTRLLLIGNGSSTRGSDFRKAFKDKEFIARGFYATKTMSCWESPNVTGEVYIKGLATREWCEEQEFELRDNPDEYKCKVLGEFPDDDSSVKVIPWNYIEEGMALWKILKEEEKDLVDQPFISKAFLDVAGEGDDFSCLVYLKGQRIFIERMWHKGGDFATMSVADDVCCWIRSLEIKPFWIGVDADVLGKGCADRIHQVSVQEPEWFGRCQVVKLQNRKADDPVIFADSMSENHWRFRDLLDPSKPLHERIALPPGYHNPKYDAALHHSRDSVMSQLNLREITTDDLSRRKVQPKSKMSKATKSPDIADPMVSLMHRPELSTDGFFA